MDALQELQAARARLVSELLAGRRSLERALHDGIQQDLTAITVQLQIAREQAATSSGAEPELLDALRLEVHAALDAVRGLAEEVYPPLLDAHGVGAALPGAARGAGVRLRLRGDESVRASRDAEAAALFACRAAFAQCGEGAEVTAELRDDDGRLRIELTPVPAPPDQLARDLVEGAGGTLAWAPDRLTLRSQSRSAR